MKTLIKASLIILALQSFHQWSNASFDTATGQYLSEQDVFVVLKSVFTKPELFQQNDSIFQELTYFPSTFADHFYEFGFINLESGQPMAQAPGESYVLKIDLFVNRVFNYLLAMKVDQFQKSLFSQSMNAHFEKKMQEHYDQYHQKLYFLSYISYYKFSSLPAEMQDLFVQDILNFVFLESALVPQALKESLMKTIVPVLNTKDLTIQSAMNVILKKAIINDYFLRY